MALIKCNECGKEISDKAATCPNCGCPIQYQPDGRANTPSWESVYSAIDCGDMMGATKLIKAITGASIQEARETALLIRNNRSPANKSADIITSAQVSGGRRGSAVRCLGCGKLYYRDMSECPGCGSSNNATTTSKYIDPSKTICTACNSQISMRAESCPRCGQPTGVHVCPNCRSTNTKVISGASKAASIVLWGPFAANKVLSKLQCKDCGHKF